MITRREGMSLGAAHVASDYGHPAASPESPASVPGSMVWPAPSGQFAGTVNVGDIGTAIAALALEQHESSRNASRLARDAAYQAEDRAHHDEIRHLRAAAEGRFGASLLQGGLQLGSAGMSLASVIPTARAGELQNNLATMGAGADRTESIADKAGHDLRAGYLGGAAKGLDASATLVPAFGKLYSDSEERAAKDAAQRGNQAKREIETRDDRVKESDRSIEKALTFLKEYLATRDATANALVRRV